MSAAQAFQENSVNRQKTPQRSYCLLVRATDPLHGPAIFTEDLQPHSGKSAVDGEGTIGRRRKKKKEEKKEKKDEDDFPQKLDNALEKL